MKHKISESDIKKVATGEKDIRDIFPSVFEEKFTGWAKDNRYPNWLGYYDNEKLLYGFDSQGSWFDYKGHISTDKTHEIPATPEQVESALIEEAKRRGFKEGVKIKAVDRDGVVDIIDFYDSEHIDYEIDYHNSLNYGNKTIYKEGKWAEIIEQPKTKLTIEEIEEKLGFGIEIVGKK